MLDWMQYLLQHNAQWISLVYVFMVFSFPLVLAYMWILVLRRPDSYVRERAKRLAISSVAFYSLSLLAAMTQWAFPLLVTSSAYKTMLCINLGGLSGLLATRARMITLTIYSFLLLTIYWLNFGVHALI
jgi:hypothetical protein